MPPVAPCVLPRSAPADGILRSTAAPRGAIRRSSSASVGCATTHPTDRRRNTTAEGPSSPAALSRLHGIYAAWSSSELDIVDPGAFVSVWRPFPCRTTDTPDAALCSCVYGIDCGTLSGVKWHWNPKTGAVQEEDVHAQLLAAFRWGQGKRARQRWASKTATERREYMRWVGSFRKVGKKPSASG
jgi:hypothetical protein